MARITIGDRPLSGNRIQITERAEVLIDRSDRKAAPGGGATSIAAGLPAWTRGESVAGGNVGGNVEAGHERICGAIAGILDAGEPASHAGRSTAAPEVGTSVTTHRQA